MKKAKNAGKRLKETLAILMIGDGVLSILNPKRHTRLWAQGPKRWEKSMKYFIKRPTLTRFLAAIELAFGGILASKQKV